MPLEEVPAEALGGGGGGAGGAGWERLPERYAVTGWYTLLAVAERFGWGLEQVRGLDVADLEMARRYDAVRRQEEASERLAMVRATLR